jgi:predicted RNA-binding Zn ribbon-like protein
MGERIMDENQNAVTIPGDFTPVAGSLPEWIDIKTVCKEAKRFVALHALSNFNVVAINDGQRVFTTNDKGGEFRRTFGRLVNDVPSADREAATLVYDCQSRRQWLAPRASAIRFLNLQV